MKVVLLNLFILVFGISNAYSDLVVHEWGTFTSVQGSDGVELDGLEHEEEKLPSFVHNRDGIQESFQGRSDLQNSCGEGCKRCCKGMCCDTFSLEGLQVTQKMETPVLYFYSKKAQKVDVTVDFPKGIISQYYPAPTHFLPRIGPNQKLEKGQIQYLGLEVLNESASVPFAHPESVYAPARKTKANIVRSGTENEKFIFYRGLGNFTTALKVTSDDSNLFLKNSREMDIPFVLAVNVVSGKGNFKVLNPIKGLKTQRQNLDQLMKELVPNLKYENFIKSVGPQLVKGLEASGLYRDESESMVETWKRSYFNTDGFRVLYILSRKETDELLPIKIEPRPKELVRTLVGRIEVITRPYEKSLLAKAKESFLGNSNLLKVEGRFKEPILKRISNLTNEQRVKRYIQSKMN